MELEAYEAAEDMKRVPVWLLRLLGSLPRDSQKSPIHPLLVCPNQNDRYMSEEYTVYYCCNRSMVALGLMGFETVNESLRSVGSEAKFECFAIGDLPNVVYLTPTFPTGNVPQTESVERDEKQLLYISYGRGEHEKITTWPDKLGSA